MSTKSSDYMRHLVRDYHFKWETSGRLISLGVPGFTPNRELGYFSSAVDVFDRLAPLLATTDFSDRFYRFVA